MVKKTPDPDAKRVLKLSKRSLKVRKSLDKSHLRNLKSKKATWMFNRNDSTIESRKADDEDVEAKSLFYEEMGFSADEAEDGEVLEGEDYEKTHRGSFRNVPKDEEKDEGIKRLPIKVNDQVLQPESDDEFNMDHFQDDFIEVDQVEMKADVSDGDQDSGTDDSDSEREKSQLSSNDKESYLASLMEEKRFVEDSKVRIACLCQNICEDPETNIKQLTDLTAMFNRSNVRRSTLLTRLLLLSVAEVFKDIVPGYKIRELTEDEKKVRVKKDVKKLRTFEEILLRDYQSYLKHMEAILKGKFLIGGRVKEEKEKSSQFSSTFVRRQLKALRPTVAHCVGTLLVNLSHFNFRTNLVRMITSLATSNHKSLAERSSNFIAQLFACDRTGEVSLEIMFYLDKILVGKAFSVHSCCLRTFLSLPISEVNYEKIRQYEINERKQKRARKQLKAKTQSRLRRKASKIEEKWVRELEELSVKENKERLNFIHGKIIGLVFACYFRVLKSVTNSKNLEVVLEGVAKLGHLIGVEFYDDLLVLIKDILVKLELSYKQRLHCVLSVFRLMSSSELELVNVDLQLFYSYLYESLLALSLVSGTDLELALSTIEEVVLRSKRDMRASRFLALCKRLCTLLLAIDNNSAMRMFTTISRTFMSQSDQLLTEETVGSGKYNPFVNDPDFANAQNTALWELHLMKSHYCPDLIPHIRTLSQLNSVKGTSRADSALVSLDKLNSRSAALGDTDSLKFKRASLKNYDNMIKLKLL